MSGNRMHSGLLECVPESGCAWFLPMHITLGADNQLTHSVMVSFRVEVALSCGTTSARMVTEKGGYAPSSFILAQST